MHNTMENCECSYGLLPKKTFEGLNLSMDSNANTNVPVIKQLNWRYTLTACLSRWNRLQLWKNSVAANLMRFLQLERMWQIKYGRLGYRLPHWADHRSLIVSPIPATVFSIFFIFSFTSISHIPLPRSHCFIILLPITLVIWLMCVRSAPPMKLTTGARFFPKLGWILFYWVYHSSLLI